MNPDLLIPVVFFLSVFMTVVFAIDRGHKLKMRKLDLGERQDGDDGELREEIDRLTIENAAIKRDLARIKRALTSTDQRIELTPYEREQLKIDQDDQFTF